MPDESLENNEKCPKVAKVSVTEEYEDKNDSPKAKNYENSTKIEPSINTEDTGDEKQQNVKKKNRCLICRKKTGLTGFGCRCGGLFCSLHRYSQDHNCSFDYKALGEKEIAKNNPVVIAQKVAKI